MSRILITGAAGFIGSHLAERLLARGDEIIGIDNFDPYYDPAVKRRNLQISGKHPSFRFHEADIRDGSSMRRLIQEAKPEVVVHLAARAGVRASLQDPQTFLEVNVLGTQTVLDACRELGIGRIVAASTSSVYSGCKNPPYGEDRAADRPLNPYAATKRANELMAYTYSHLYGLDITMLRFFTVYGPRQRPDMAIHKFARLIEAGKPVPMFGAGNTVRDYTYIDDIIDGVVSAIDRPFRYEIINLGAGRTTDLYALIGKLGAALGKTAAIDQLPLQPGDALETLADISKARRLLGYAPSFDVDTGLSRFVAWLRESEAASAARERHA
jgi:UDP-glucuronate 4-epimerase